MGSFGSSCFSLVSLLLVLLLLITPSFAGLSLMVTKQEINDICSKTSNPSFCSQVLNSDPRVATADLPGLAQISIDIGHAKALDTFKYIKSLLKQVLPQDPSLHERYLSCSENYDEAIDNFEMAEGAVSARSYAGAKSAISGALTQADTCNDDLQGSPPDPSQLHQRNQNILNLCNIIFAILDRL